ncbi:MAG: hypothetical protein V2B19_12335, partial [Pseudomonadota bacterium]
MTERTQRSAKAFKFGLFGPVQMGSDQARTAIGECLGSKQGRFLALNRCFWGQKGRFKKSSSERNAVT